jgi:hypothetical protein
MERQIAQEIHNKLIEYQGVLNVDPKIIDYRPPGRIQGFHRWADQKKFECGFLVQYAEGEAIWILLSEWTEKFGYYLVLFPRDRSGLKAEIHEFDEGMLTWTYSPSKRGGKNSERVSYFTKYFLSPRVVISVPEHIAEVSEFIVELMSLFENRIKADNLDDDTPEYRDGFPEGKRREKLHKYRERDTAQIKALKNHALLNGTLQCQCCQFDFALRYGEIGRGFIEAHHTVPVSTLNPDGDIIRIEEISLVCSNCHRMLHRRRPWLTMDELINVLEA